MKNYEQTNPKKNEVHRILAYSYLIYFIFFLAGLFLDLLFSFQVSSNSFMLATGIFFLILGTLFIFWAQKTSRRLNTTNLSKEVFYRGPYRFTRSPTHWGLFLLLLGVGMVLNGFFVMVFAFLAFLISKFTFLNKQEKILAEKYGEPYIEYKKTVKF